MMTKLEAIIQPAKFESVKQALIEIGVDGMTASEVRGHGRQKGHTETYHGHEYSVDLLPKIKLEIVMDNGLVDKAVERHHESGGDRENWRRQDLPVQGRRSHSDSQSRTRRSGALDRRRLERRITLNFILNVCSAPPQKSDAAQRKFEFAPRSGCA